MTKAVNTSILATGPAFSAWSQTQSTLSTGTWVKVPMNYEEFDTNSCYDNVTNYRFTPNVAGYYQVDMNGACGATNAVFFVALYKNGSVFKTVGTLGNNSNGTRCSFSTLIYLNGTTDYIEMYEQVNGSSTVMSDSNITYGDTQYMCAYLVRGA